MQSTDDASTRERILTAARDLFGQRGFDATPTLQIAERAAAHCDAPQARLSRRCPVARRGRDSLMG